MRIRTELRIEQNAGRGPALAAGRSGSQLGAVGMVAAAGLEGQNAVPMWPTVHGSNVSLLVIEVAL